MKTLTTENAAIVTGGKDPWYETVFVTIPTYLLGGYNMN